MHITTLTQYKITLIYFLLQMHNVNHISRMKNTVTVNHAKSTGLTAQSPTKSSHIGGKIVPNKYKILKRIVVLCLFSIFLEL